MKRHTDYSCNHGCFAESTLEIIRGKWKGVLITLLLDRSYRFSEFQKVMPGITQRILTKQLRELEDAGIVDREVVCQKPFAVQYSLTELGMTLGPVMACLKQWGSTYGNRLPTPTEGSVEEPAQP